MRTEQAPKKVVILGATSAIAEATARLYAESGAELLLVGRDASKLEGISRDLAVRGAHRVMVELQDLSDEHDPFGRVDQFAATLGRVDVALVAYGLLGDSAEVQRSSKDVQKILDVNFTSAALWCEAIARQLERQKFGVLLALTSVAGDRGRQSNYMYGAAKGGLSVYVQGLAHRLASSGARAVAVKLGFVDTPMTAAFQKTGPLWSTPSEIAKALIKVAEKRTPVVYVPWFWRLIMLAIRLTPSAVFHRTKL